MLDVISCKDYIQYSRYLLTKMSLIIDDVYSVTEIQHC